MDSVTGAIIGLSLVLCAINYGLIGIKKTLEELNATIKHYIRTK